MAEVQILGGAMDGHMLTPNPSFYRNSSSGEGLNSGFGAAFTFCTVDIILWVLLLFITIGSYRNKGLLRIFGELLDKSRDLKHGFWLRYGVFGLFPSKMSSCLIVEKSLKISEEISEEEENHGDGDEEMSIEELKKAIEVEREEKNTAFIELDKERMSSTLAANEAMDMIMRLQSEKSSIQMESNQSKRLSEQKQHYDQEIIQSLQWVIFKHESDTSVLETQLKLCKLKLKEFLNLDEMEEFEEELVLNCANVVDEDGASSGSLDTDSSSMMYAIAKRKYYSDLLQISISLGRLYGTATYFVMSILQGDNFASSPFYFKFLKPASATRALNEAYDRMKEKMVDLSNKGF